MKMRIVADSAKPTVAIYKFVPPVNFNCEYEYTKMRSTKNSSHFFAQAIFE